MGRSDWLLKKHGRFLLAWPVQTGMQTQLQTRLSEFIASGRPANGLADEALRIEKIVQHLNPVRTTMNPVRTLIVILLRTFSQ